MTPVAPAKPGPLTRRIQSQAPKPEPWKPAWMRRLPARDETHR